MKKLTLDIVWERCLKMWGWIIEQLVLDNTQRVEVLKTRARKQFGYKEYCYFCTWAGKQGVGCVECPGKLVNRCFDCTNQTYNYEDRPRAFYKKLLQLNKKRLKDRK